MEGEQRNVKTPLLGFASALRLTIKAWPVIALATIGLCYLTQTVAGWFGIDLKEQETVRIMRDMGFYTWRTFRDSGFVELFRHEASQKFLINIPLVLLLAPIFEEAFFRGLLTRLTAGKDFVAEHIGRRTVVCAILSSILFSLAHYLQMPNKNNAFIALFFFGLAQCWLYKKTDRLWCAMLNHGLFNLTNLVLLFVLPEAA